MELDALEREKAQLRAKRQQLTPLWKIVATLADAWSKEHISRRLF